MPESMFASVIQNGTITLTSFLLSTVVSLAIGFVIALVYSRLQICTMSFAVTLVLLPVLVELVIMMVNGNIGAGVAVAGAFSLVRFRSAQGTGQEIMMVFFSMAVGLATGMGYLTIAILFSVIVLAAFALLSKTVFEEKPSEDRLLKITIPETLDYESVFDRILEKYTKEASLEEVRTTEMGSLYRLRYRIRMKEGCSEKAMMDEIRTRNGNLEVSCGRVITREWETL